MVVFAIEKRKMRDCGFGNGDDGEERFPYLSITNRWAPCLVGPMCQCLNGRMGYVRGSSSEERGGGFAMEKRERSVRQRFRIGREGRRAVTGSKSKSIYPSIKKVTHIN